MKIVITTNYGYIFTYVVVTTAAKGTRTCLWSKKLSFTTKRAMKLITFSPLEAQE